MKSFFQRTAFRFRHGICGRFRSELRKLRFRILGMKISEGTYLGRVNANWPHQVSIGGGTVIEEDVSFKFDGPWKPGPNIHVGNRAFLGRGSEFNVRKSVRIGDHCAIASGCRFVDHNHGITGDTLDETPGEEQDIVIGHHVWLGANVVVLKGLTIGNGAVVGAGSVVTKSIPSGEIWAGIPARRLSSRNEKASATLPLSQRRMTFEPVS